MVYFAASLEVLHLSCSMCLNGTHTVRFSLSEIPMIDISVVHLQKCEIFNFFPEENYGCAVICLYFSLFFSGVIILK